MASPPDYLQFVVKNEHLLTAYAYCVTGDWADADAAVRECLVLARHRWDSLVSDVEIWRLLRSVAVSLLDRAELDRPAGGTSPQAGWPQPAGGITEAGILARERSFMELPLRQREAVALVFGAGLEVAAAAAVMGIGRSAVRIHLARTSQGLATWILSAGMDDQHQW